MSKRMMKNRQTRVDIIVCYNNEKLYRDLEKSIQDRGGSGVQWNIIGVDNTKNSFRSAAEAYNQAFKNSTGECVIFCHQDVLFLEKSLSAIAEKCLNFPHTLWGAAGVEKAGQIISNMSVLKEGWKYGTLEKGSDAKVQTLDECMIAASRSLFEKFQFDEETCNGWHLYAVDLSLQCILQNYEVKVLDANIVHLSGGNMDYSFWKTEKSLVKKYRGKIHKINTTCFWTYTNPLLFMLLRLYRRVRYGIALK